MRRLSNSGTVNSVLGRLRGRGFRPGWASGSPVKASFVTAMAGANNDMVFTDAFSGVQGNTKRIRIVVSGNNTALAIARSGDDYTITSATDGGGVATSTPTTIITAWQALPDINNRLKIAKKVGDDGTGVVAAFAFASLTGGTG